MRPFPHLFVESEKSFSVWRQSSSTWTLNNKHQLRWLSSVLCMFYYLFFLFSGCDCNDLFFDSKCFFIILLLDSHLSRHESQSKPRDGEFVELIITNNSKKMIVHKEEKPEILQVFLCFWWDFSISLIPIGEEECFNNTVEICDY